MWISRHRRRPAGLANGWQHNPAPPPPPKAPYRIALWAALGVAALMLTTFVLFGATVGGTVKFIAPTSFESGPTSDSFNPLSALP